MEHLALELERPHLSDEELDEISKDDLVKKWRQLDAYSVHAEKCLDELKSKMREKALEIGKLKNILLMNFACTKDMDAISNVQPDVNSEQNQLANCTLNKQSAFVDPSINAIIIQLKKELEETRKKKDYLQDELNSTRFNPESQLTKRLMFKCRKLLQENEEIGKLISSGNIAQLENDLAYHKQLLNEACENEQNVNTFLIEIDDEMDAMQATILKLQEKLVSTSNAIVSDSMATEQESKSVL